MHRDLAQSLFRLAIQRRRFHRSWPKKVERNNIDRYIWSRIRGSPVATDRHSSAGESPRNGTPLHLELLQCQPALNYGRAGPERSR